MIRPETFIIMDGHSFASIMRALARMIDFDSDPDFDFGSTATPAFSV